MPRPIPSRVGRYEIADRLGEGGMGVLYLARDPLLERSVAIKMLTVHNTEFAQRFAREARSAAALKHPNIVTIYDVGEENGEPFIAMEYVEGETLVELIRRRAPMSLQLKLGLLCELCAGLGFAHRAGIVHRDIKPANVMVTAEGGVKILDFGLARLMGDMSDAGLTAVGTIMGTPHYMSPEQVDGKPADHRSDIWAFGLVAFELLTFEKAYQGDNLRAVMHQIASREPRPLSSVLSGVDKELEGVIARTTRHAPEDRYQTLSAPLERLNRIRDRLAREADEDTLVVSNENRILQPVSNPVTPSSGGPRLGNPQAIAQRRADQIAAHLTKAREHLHAGALEAAIEMCELAAVIDPQHPEMLDVLGQVHRALDDRNVRAWLDEARGHLSHGLFSQAEALIARSLELRPDLAEAAELLEAVHSRRAEIELQRERARRLSAALQRAQDNLANDVFEAAIRAANEALAIELGNTEALDIKRKASAGIEARARREVEERAESLLIRANALVARDDYTGALNLLKAFKEPHHGIDKAVATVTAEIEARNRRRGEEERRRREEEERRRQQEEARRREEEARARDEARRREEEAARLRERERRRVEEEENARRREEEARAREAARLRDEARLEEEARRQEEARREEERAARWRDELQRANDAAQRAKDEMRRQADQRRRAAAIADAGATEVRPPSVPDAVSESVAGGASVINEVGIASVSADAGRPSEPTRQRPLWRWLGAAAALIAIVSDLSVPGGATGVPGRRWKLPVILGMAAGAVLIAWLVAPKPGVAPHATPTTERSEDARAVAVPPQTVTVNAVPWARVRIVAASGTPEPVERTTPFVITLPPGEYRIDFQNPSFGGGSQTLVVGATAPSTIFLKLPGVDVDQIVAAVLGSK